MISSPACLPTMARPIGEASRSAPWWRRRLRASPADTPSCRRAVFDAGAPSIQTPPGRVGSGRSSSARSRPCACGACPCGPARTTAAPSPPGTRRSRSGRPVRAPAGFPSAAPVRSSRSRSRELVFESFQDSRFHRSSQSAPPGALSSCRSLSQHEANSQFTISAMLDRTGEPARPASRRENHHQPPAPLRRALPRSRAGVSTDAGDDAARRPPSRRARRSAPASRSSTVAGHRARCWRLRRRASLQSRLERAGVEVVTASRAVMDGWQPRPHADRHRRHRPPATRAAPDAIWRPRPGPRRQHRGRAGSRATSAPSSGPPSRRRHGRRRRRRSADPFGWKALRGAMGSAFRLPDRPHGQPRPRRPTPPAPAGIRCIATVPAGGVDLFDVRPARDRRWC